MIGFPKTPADFLKQDSFLKKEFDHQVRSYLSHQDFFSKKTEDWKYFPFQKALRPNFAFNPDDFIKPKYKIAPHLPNSLFLTVQNGQALPSFKATKDLFICSWRDFLLSSADMDFKIKKKILSTLKKERNPFCALSNVFYANGLILVIKKSLKQPLEIHYQHTAKKPPQGFNLRNFVFVEDGASAQIVEIFSARPKSQPLFVNIQTDCFVGEKAVLEHSRLDQMSRQDVFISQIFSQLSQEAKASFFSLSLQAGISRWLVDLDQEEKSSSETRGLSLLEGQQYSDHKAMVCHKKREGESRQLYQSLLFDSARQVFQGFVSIEKPAQKSSAGQLSKNFLFGKKASAVAFPKLDVTADDVQANHGAVVSPFSENRDILFYLQSRGIDPLRAFDMILSGLIKEMFSNLSSSAQSLAQSLIVKKIAGLKDSIKENIIAANRQKNKDYKNDV